MVTNAKPKTGGSVHVAPLGTTLPTDATTALAAAFESLGYISEDGITNSTTRESASIKEWGGSTVLNPQTEFEATYKMTFLDSVDLNVLKAVFGSANVTGTLATGITVKVNADELDEQQSIWSLTAEQSRETSSRVVRSQKSVTSSMWQMMLSCLK